MAFGEGTFTAAIPSPEAKGHRCLVAVQGSWHGFGWAVIGVGGSHTAKLDAANGKMWNNMETANSPGSAAGLWAANYNVCRRDWSPKLTVRIRPVDVDSSFAIWAGFVDSGFVDYDTGGNEHAGFRWDLVQAGDTNWMASCRESGVQTLVDTGVTPAAQEYLMEIELDHAAGEARFSIDGALVATITTNLPAAATPLGFDISILKAGTGQKSLDARTVVMEWDYA